jgi:chemotaxis protein CheX
MSVTTEDLGQIVEEVLTAFLPDLSHANPEDDEPTTVAAIVHISGTWTGSVVVSCSDDLATRTAASMLEAEPSGLSGEDISDALGEVANMIGGGVKAMMPEPSVLSLPVVAFGGGQNFVPGTVEVQSGRWTCDGHPLTVTVLEHDFTA